MTKLINQLLSLQYVRDFSGVEELRSVTANKFLVSHIIRFQLKSNIKFTTLNTLCVSPLNHHLSKDNPATSLSLVIICSIDIPINVWEAIDTCVSLTLI